MNGVIRRVHRQFSSPAKNAFSGLFPNVSRKEWRFPVLVAVAAVGSTLPAIAIGYLRAPAGTIFTGFGDTSPGDDLTYLAAMKQGAQGHWLWQDLYTSVPHPSVLVYPFYTALGQFQGLTHLPPVLVFHAARVLFGFVLVILVYGFCSRFFPGRGPRRIAFLLAVFGGGISPLLVSVLGWPVSAGVDTSIAAAGVFSTINGPPHLAIAGIGLLVILCVAAAGPGLRPVVSLSLAAVAGMACALVYPQLPLFTAFLLLVVAMWERRLWPAKVALVALLAAAPYIAYAAYLRLTHPIVSAWIGGEVAFPLGDPVSFVLIAHTVPATAFILAVATRAIRLPRKAILPLIWIAAVIVFAYAPSGVVVLTRVLFVVSVPFGIVGCWGLLGVARLAARPAVRRRLIVYGVQLAAMVSVYELLVAFLLPLAQLDPLRVNYVPTDLRRAMALLEQRPPGLVMNLFLSGQFVPPYSGHGTYIGHQAETLDVLAREQDALNFYRMSDAGRSQFMRDQHISYVLVSRAERAVADAAQNPVRTGGTFQLLFSIGDVQLYQRRG